MYRRPFHLFLPDEQSQYRSFLGSVLSIFTVALIASFATWKLDVLISYDDYKVRVHDQESFYPDDEAFGSVDGF